MHLYEVCCEEHVDNCGLFSALMRDTWNVRDLGDEVARLQEQECAHTLSGIFTLSVCA
jgi:hypothetical protein